MKNILRNISLAAGLTSLFSCSAKLDSVSPDTQISFDKISSSNLPLVVNGIKLAITNTNAFYLYYSYQDIMSDDVESIAYPTWEANNVLPTDNGLTFMYKAPYTAIATANMAIRFGDAHPGDSTIRTPLGEAYFLRAYSWMLLSEHFGGVVLVYGGEDPRSRPRRDSLGAVNAQIEKDLLRAKDLLPDYTIGTSASKQAAQLLLARIYLNQGRNDEALSMATAVINSGKLSLTNKFGDIFVSGTNTSESLFRLNEMTSPSSDQYGLAYNFGPGKNAGSTKAGNGNSWIDSNLVKSYDKNDVRRGFFLRSKGGSILDSVYFLTKFPQEYNNSYPICRYPEALLIATEATARKGTINVTWYNQLRTARNASTRQVSDFANAAAFLSEIEQERRREFVGERLRWQDMQRFGKRDAWLQSFGQPVTHALLPIPGREIFTNPNLDQNPDYTK
ncbi:RagB/SusD family nutrient uptake outer membrane protein [Chitinophaga sp. Cy-1792]|uniref:RagB/SusD family nutrient uptake outer membrane protein n=1 Tax=Chitinophaga sp. Cy-1792 TaxID=2608339 RepID=UPI00142409FC|nr:RagB/SusD family nutrient uptake outer membrane protein [Chitinophaga sp. Cy-1792]NIG55529.1 RagB/SusD family nutrient uptake outer membrane protein [Chitinophaga sp. Cy-1792]